jgi:Arc/MetJ-type ribon-helix-helix transcriptional regulator
MKIELQANIESLLKAQVEAGLFGSVEEAVAAAVTAAYEQASNDLDLAWARPYLEQADRDIAAGKTFTHTQVWDHMAKRFGP